MSVTEQVARGTGRAERYGDAVNAAKDKMNTHSIILIDGIDQIHPVETRIHCSLSA